MGMQRRSRHRLHGLHRNQGVEMGTHLRRLRRLTCQVRFEQQSQAWRLCVHHGSL